MATQYTLVHWPECQALMEEEWFGGEAIFADTENTAYFIPTEYLFNSSREEFEEADSALQYVLVKTRTEFYDGHGSPDDGGKTISLDIIYDDNWEKYMSYDNWDEEKDEGQAPFTEGVEYNHDGYAKGGKINRFSASDGYNCIVTWKKINLIDKATYDKINETLEAYKKL